MAQPDPWKAEVALRLFKAREAVGLSQKAVAKMIGLGTTDAVGTWERGQKLPSARSLMKLARLYNRSLDWLLVVNDAPEMLPDFAVMNLGLEMAILDAQTLAQREEEVERNRWGERDEGGMLQIEFGYVIPAGCDVVPAERYFERRERMEKRIALLKEKARKAKGERTDGTA